jgi:hypothetical protein
MLCNCCHERESKVEVTIKDSKSGREFSQRFCDPCATEILTAHPDAAKELNDAQAEQRPANIKSPRPNGFLRNTGKSFDAVLDRESTTDPSDCVFSCAAAAVSYSLLLESFSPSLDSL